MSNRNQLAVQFLKQAKIKTRMLGGFDKTDTYRKFKELSDLYEEIVTVEREAEAALKADYEKKLEEMRFRLDCAETETAKAMYAAADLRKRLASMENRADSTERQSSQNGENKECPAAELRQLQEKMERAQEELARLKKDPENEEFFLHQEAEFAAHTAALAAQKAENATLRREKAELEQKLSALGLPCDDQP